MERDRQMSYTFIASPYSDPSEHLMQKRYEEARRFCAWCFVNGMSVFSPIVSWHEVASHHQLPRDAQAYKALNREMLGPAEELIVLCIDGWRESRGVQMEVIAAARQGKLIKWAWPADDGEYEIMLHEDL